MEEVTKVAICLCIDDDESVLLAKRKTGFGADKIFGAGKLIGPSGEIRLGEKPDEAAIQRLWEESHLTGKAEDLKQVALLYIYFQNALRFTCYVYTLHKWQGKPQETPGTKKAEMYKFSKLPLGTSDMCAGDQKWLPRVLMGGQEITARIYYDNKGTCLDDFDYESATFKK